jgi:hypothetical protein
MINYIILILSLLNKYNYGSYNRAILKQKYGIRGLVQDHHIIPRQFSRRVSIDVDSSKNLIMLPTSYGKLFLNTSRPIHENGHPKYNKYIEQLLNQNATEEFIIFFLRQQLLNGNIIRIL